MRKNPRSGLVQEAAKLRSALVQKPPDNSKATSLHLLETTSQHLGTILMHDGEIRFTWVHEKFCYPQLDLQFWAANSSGYMEAAKGRALTFDIRDLPALADILVKALDLAKCSSTSMVTDTRKLFCLREELTAIRWLCTLHTCKPVF